MYLVKWIPIVILTFAMQISNAQRNGNQQYIHQCFVKTDDYMNFGKYDSAQIWLNKIREILPLNKNTDNKYFLHIRQAEIYYYNNLHLLGLNETNSALNIAEIIGNKYLLADSYNFLGLFYANMDSLNKATISLHKSLEYLSKAKSRPPSLFITMPHHVLGNLAEVFYKQQVYDSAIYYYKASITKAKIANINRGIALSYSGLGDVYFAQEKYTTALDNYKEALTYTNNIEHADVALVLHGLLAKSYSTLNNKPMMQAQLDSGFALLQNRNNINRFFALLFLNDAYKIFKSENNKDKLLASTEMILAFEKESELDYRNKLHTIIETGIINEKKVNEMALSNERQLKELANTRFMFALAVIAIFIIGFIVYRYYQKQKNAVNNVRQKLSRDLHDDIGASLSSLHIYANIAENTIHTRPEKTMEMLGKINNQSKEIMENMSDIVWSMRSNDMDNTPLDTKIKNYAAELLHENNIEFELQITSDAALALESIHARKNILLIIKEALNNIAKHSNANMCTVNIFTRNKLWIMEIFDNGNGFDTSVNHHGNGLKNITNRTKELNGKIKLSCDNNCNIHLEFPVSIISDTHS